MKSIKTILSLCAVALCGLLPAVYNGAPLIFYDGIYYYRSAVKGILLHDRPTLYAPFIATFAGTENPWYWIAVQAFLASIILHLVLYYAMRQQLKWSQSVLLCLFVILTPLGIECSYLMADFSSGLLILLVSCMIAYWERISILWRVFTSVLTLVLLAFHLSHVPIIILLAGSALTLLIWKRATMKRHFVSLVLIGALVIVCLYGFKICHQKLLGVNRTSSVGGLFLFASFYAQGPLKQQLEERCSSSEGQVELAPFCEWRHELPTKAPPAILFERSPLNIFRKDWSERNELALQVLKKLIPERPFSYLSSIIRNGFLLFKEFGTKSAFMYYDENIWKVHERGFKEAFKPFFLQQILESKQMRRTWPHGPTDRIFWILYWGGLIGALAIIWRGRRKFDEPFIFGFLLLSGVILNALVSGGLSEVASRYQLRVAWIPAFYCLVYLLTSGVLLFKRPNSQRPC